jgi:hypothetical protein
VPGALQRPDDPVLVLGEDLGEPVGPLHEPAVHRIRFHEGGGVEDAVAHADLAGGLGGDGDLVAGHHLHVHSQLARPLQRPARVLARRVLDRQHAAQPPVAVV